MNVICFHNPDEENAYLSNWFYCEFIVEGIKFNDFGKMKMEKTGLLV